jgi:hypothetical protein
LVSGASAAAVASMIGSLLSSEARWVFFPSLPLQTAAALLFVLGLLAGDRVSINRYSACRRQCR